MDTNPVSTFTISEAVEQPAVLSGGRAVSVPEALESFAAVSGGTTITAGEVVYNVSSAIIEPGGTNMITAGGSALDTFVSSGGSDIISSGGTGINEQVVSGGSQIVYGLDSGTIIRAGSEIIEAGGTGINNQVASGGGQYVYGLDSGTIIGWNGWDVISSGGTGIDDQITSGGVQYVRGLASGTIIGSRALDIISSGGTGISDQVALGGSEVVYGLASGTLISSGGVEFIKAGGTSISAQLAAGGKQYVYNLASGTLISSSGAEIILSRGTGMSDQVALGGSEVVYGLASGTIINAGGSEIILSHGTGVNDQVASGGTVIVSAGGVELVSGGVGSGVSISAGGVVSVASGGTAENDIINSGAVVSITNGANLLGAAISSGGVVSVASGGTATSNIVSFGGVVSVASGGKDFGDYINSGGVVELASGGTGVNIIVSAAGTAIEQAANGLSGAIISSGGNIDFAYIAYTSGVTASTNKSVDSLMAYEGVTASLNTSTDLLTVSAGGSTYTDQLSGTYSAALGNNITIVSDLNGTVDVKLTCYLAGTKILLADGAERVVEEIMIGDALQAQDAGHQVARDVTWVGRQTMRVDASRPDDEAGYPVRIVKNALSAGVPYQDLLVTPEHCLYLEGRFIPARMLVNGSTIDYDRSFTQYEFYHVETATHSVITANGALSESYLDTGDRHAFAQPYAVVAMGRRQLSWEHDAAAPLCVEREIVERIHIALSQRAVELGAVTRGKVLHTTPEHDLQIITPSGEVLQQVAKTGNVYAYLLPSGVESVRLVSRAARPADTIGPFVDDRRYLGVQIGTVTVSNATGPVPVQRHLQEAELAGWHGLEDAAVRWTNGDALLPLPAGEGRMIRLLHVEVCGSVLYELDQAHAQTLATRRA